jgi:hypothetical protein
MRERTFAGCSAVLSVYCFDILVVVFRLIGVNLGKSIDFISGKIKKNLFDIYIIFSDWENNLYIYVNIWPMPPPAFESCKMKNFAPGEKSCKMKKFRPRGKKL